MTMDLYAHVLPDTKAKRATEDSQPILTVDYSAVLFTL